MASSDDDDDDVGASPLEENRLFTISTTILTQATSQSADSNTNDLGVGRNDLEVKAFIFHQPSSPPAKQCISIEVRNRAGDESSTIAWSKTNKPVHLSINR